jgi:hypothetical protein
MDAREIYERAQEAARDGRYEEALHGYRWFHEHALDEQPSLYGVRLSYAMSDWADLAKVYPPAMAALKDARDKKVERLLVGKGDHALFHDVKSINDYLENHGATYELFVTLHKKNPTLARECVGLAMESIVKAKDFALARGYIKNPEAKIKKWSALLNEDIADLANEPPRDAPVRGAYVHIYAERVRLMLAVLNGVGEAEYAESIRRAALDSVESTPVREAVNVALSNGAEA